MALEPLTTLDGFEPGSAVEVTAGPLRGIQGVIARVKNGQRLILHVESLGRAAVTVDANQVTLI
jgi:transcription antitermination factor NusG